MTFKDIVTKKTYAKNGQEKALWNNVGTLKIMDDGKMFIDLAMFPNTAFYVFDRKPKETTPTNDQGRDDKGFNQAEGEINPDDIPFN